MKQEVYTQPYKVGDHVTVRPRATKDGWTLYLDINEGGCRRTRKRLNKHLKRGDKVNNTRLWLEACAMAKAEDERVTERRTGRKPKKRADEKVLLLDWMKAAEDERKKKAEAAGRRRASAAEGMHQSATYLQEFLQREGMELITLSEIDNDFMFAWGRFVAQLKKDGKPLAPATRNGIYNKVATAINDAVRHGKLAPEHAPNVKKKYALGVPVRTINERAFLTEDEIRAMATTPCSRPEIKAAFLFACLTGLRYGDLQTLTWGDIVDEGGSLKLVKKMVKTQKPVTVYLNSTAAALLPKRRGGKELVFNLGANQWANRHLKAWAEAAGIKKHVSYHVARHTFATLNLTKGTDLYTTSKLLGHTNVATTAIYAKLVDQKRQAAADLINIDLGL